MQGRCDNGGDMSALLGHGRSEEDGARLGHRRDRLREGQESGIGIERDAIPIARARGGFSCSYIADGGISHRREIPARRSAASLSPSATTRQIPSSSDTPSHLASHFEDR